MMSFLDNSSSLGGFLFDFDWNVFSRRPEALQDVELVSPVAEISTILMHRQTTYLQEQQLAEQERKQLLDALAQQATHFAELMIVLRRYDAVLEHPQEHIETIKRAYRSLAIMKNKMLEDFSKNGFEIVIPLGKKYEEVKEDVDIHNWRHSEIYTDETVIEVMQPTIFYKKTRLRNGLVVMGAPLETDADSTIAEA